MIECSNEFIYKKSCKKRWIIIFVLSAMFILAIFCYNNLTKYISTICNDKIGAIATNASNKAIEISLSNSTNYNDLIKVEKNAQGEIILLSASTYKINKITNEIVVNTNMIMTDIISKGVPVPSLAFSGIPILSGYGKNINFKSINIKSVNGNFVSNFKSVGVNQTLHSIYIEICVNSIVEFPFIRKQNQTKSQVLICETVLVGKIPDTYLNADIFK